MCVLEAYDDDDGVDEPKCDWKAEHSRCEKSKWWWINVNGIALVMQSPHKRQVHILPSNKANRFPHIPDDLLNIQCIDLIPTTTMPNKNEVWDDCLWSHSFWLFFYKLCVQNLLWIIYYQSLSVFRYMRQQQQQNWAKWIIICCMDTRRIWLRWFCYFWPISNANLLPKKLIRQLKMSLESNNFHYVIDETKK